VAVRIIRQPNKIALLGVPTSAAALAAGPERAPAALRGAGLVDALRGIGYEVADLGDDPPQLYQPDEESPRARNLPRVVASLEALKPRVEAAVKSGALPLILSGDCSIALATVAGARRYFRSVSLAYFDRDADLNTPATTPSGCVDGMVIAHMTGRGAAELVRFWGEPPLVREPDIVLFGVDRFDQPEEELLRRATIRRYLAADIQRRGVTVAAQEALERIHGKSNEFVLHFDLDVISSEDFSATSFPGSGGLRWDEVREALEVFVTQKHLGAFEVTGYNPERDPDGSGAERLVELLVSVLAARLRALPEAAQAPASAAPEPSSSPASPEADPGSHVATDPLDANPEPATPEGPNEPG
jgi:arginase